MIKRYKGAAADRRNRRILAANPVCWICGQPIDLTLDWLDPMSGQIDHKRALARGGTEDRSNLAPAHRKCNRAKSDKDHAPIVRRSGSLD